MNAHVVCVVFIVYSNVLFTSTLYMYIYVYMYYVVSFAILLKLRLARMTSQRHDKLTVREVYSKNPIVLM